MNGPDIKHTGMGAGGFAALVAGLVFAIGTAALVIAAHAFTPPQPRCAPGSLDALVSLCRVLP